VVILSLGTLRGVGTELQVTEDPFSQKKKKLWFTQKLKVTTWKGIRLVTLKVAWFLFFSAKLSAKTSLYARQPR
jgi:hypothetical protein